MNVKASYTGKDLRRYQLGIQCMRWLGWVTLAGVIWLGVVLGIHYVDLPYVAIYLARALSRLWTALGRAILALLAVLVIAVCCSRGLFPTLSKYLRSCPSTVELLDWFRAGIAPTSEDGSVTVPDSKRLEGFIAYLDHGCVLVAVFVPKGVNGQAVVDNATSAIKEYADSVLPGLKSGAVQRTAGARYWIYRRPKS